MRVAVVGSGIAGLTAAWSLSTRHEVTVFEKSSSPGMDAHSLDIETPEGLARVDVPLRVFFDGFYPNLTKLYRLLSVEFKPVNYSASFGLLGEKTYFRFDNYRVGRYSVPFLRGRRSLSRKGLRIGFDNLRFFRALASSLAKGVGDDVTLEAYLSNHKYSKAFAEGFLYPAFAGICTCSHESIKAYPARVVLEYLNSGLLLSSVQRVTQGTREVVDRLSRDVNEFRLEQEITEVRQTEAGVEVRTRNVSEMFDHVVMATQANQTAQILNQTSAEERDALTAFRYEPSRVLVHSDETLAPPGGAGAWAPVNFLLPNTSATPMATIWLNPIQALPDRTPIFQSWNPVIDPNPRRVLGEASFERPVVNARSLRGLAQLEALHAQPDRRIWFCGSYASHGIPLLESAAHSALSVAERLGCQRPWAVEDNILRLQA
ncbi:MAG: FAD-dependent oxidoreductase [Pseudomonadota bacterium]